MRLRSIEGNGQRLDGGAMFGNCPRTLWAKWSPPDDLNRIRLACRSLLITEDDGRNVLLETGIGAFFAPKLRERFGVFEERHLLIDSLAAAGVRPEDIDVVVLSHLHFDHAGGLLAAYREGAAHELIFPNAHFVVGKEAWARANHPHARDRASFIPELQPLLEATGKLEIVEGDRSRCLGERYRFFRSEGHTPGLLLTRFEGAKEGPITFMGDLVPGVPWVHLPITMGYDRFPERLIEEKLELLSQIEANDEWIFFTHDPDVVASKVKRDAGGKFQASESLGRLDW